MCTHVFEICMPSTVHMWRSEGSKQKLVLSFYPGSLGCHSGGLAGLLTDPGYLCKVEGACLSTSEVQLTLSASSHSASLWYKAPQWLPTGMRVWPWVLTLSLSPSPASSLSWLLLLHYDQLHLSHILLSTHMEASSWTCPLTLPLFVNPCLDWALYGGSQNRLV